eukprot:g3189.t1
MMMRLARRAAQSGFVQQSLRQKSTAVAAYDTMSWLTPVQGRPVFLHQESEVEDKTFLEAIGLDSWYRKGPILAAASLTAISREWYVLNEETFVAACLTGFGWMTYVLAREPVLNWYYDGAGELLDAQNLAEDRHAAAARTYISMASKTGNIASDVEAAFKDRADLISVEAKAKAVKERALVKSEFERKLGMLVNQKQAEEAGKYAELVEEATAFAMKEAQSPAFKKAALAWAIAGLKDPKSQGKDPVLGIYEKFMSSRK